MKQQDRECKVKGDTEPSEDLGEERQNDPPGSLAFGQAPAPGDDPAPTTEGRELDEILSDLAKDVPAEEWAKLPADLIDNLDHYTAGADRR